MRKVLITALLLSAAAILSFGQEEDKPVSVKSTIYSEVATPIDTLKTTTPRLCMVIFANGTWEFRKDPEAISQDSTFTSYWNTTVVHPYYSVDLEKIPSRITIVLKDSLDSYCCPDHSKVFSKFGPRHGRRHNGVDIPSPTGTPVYACFPGKVRISQLSSGYGNLVIIRHENGLETYYGHLSERSVEAGQWVNGGQVIGKVGSTGRSTGPHLHFETRYQGYAFDPEWIIDFNSGDLRADIWVLKRKYFSIYSNYTPESIDEEEDIVLADEKAAEELKRIQAEREAMKYHTVKSGDTLSAIAVKYGTTVSKICSLNGIKATSILSIGKKLRVK